MIRFLKGKFHPMGDGTVIIESGSGIGFLVNVPANSHLYKNLEGEDVKVYTHMIVREDDMSLYGFSHKDELELFKLLITVNGVGAKAAMAIMSILPQEELRRAVATGDSKAISAANGIGKKTSERIILELKDKVGEFVTEEDKFIREVDNIDYITYLNKQKGLVLSNVDARNITEIQEKYNFPTGVLNILLEYSINTSNSSGLPHKNYIDKIASSWQSQRLLGAKDAIEFVRKSRNMRTVRKNVDKTASVWNSNTNRKVYKAPFPEYLKQQMENISTIKSSQNRVVTQEDEDAYNEMMKELTRKKDT